MQKQSLVDRILAIISGGDKAKLSRFESKLNKYLDKQISMRRESIETLREKIIDGNEAINDAVTGVDVDKIGSTDGADRYVSDYVRKVSEKLAIVENLEADIKVQEEEIARFEKLKGLIYPEVAE